MNKFIPLFFGLMLPLTSALADSFTDEAVEFCRSKGGAYSMASMVEQGDKYCRQVTCKKTNSDKYVINESDKGPEANVEATKQVCVAKSIVDGNFNTNGAGNSAGSSSGSTSGSTSGATSGSSSGSSSGATAGAAAGSAAGSSAGSAAGASAGSSSGSGSGDAITCEELEGEGVIQPGGLCYSECKPKRDWKTLWTSKKEGFERKSCVECLLRYPGVYRVKKEYLPKDKDGKVIGDNSVSLGRGVTVKTGVIVCKDANGKVVSITGSACPTGMTIHTTSGSGSGGGTIIVAGGAASGSGAGVGGGINIGGSIGVAGGVGGGAGVQLPAYCNSSKQKDIDKCQEWMTANRRFLCSSSSNPSLCLGGEYNEINARYSTTDCVNCQVGSRGKQSTLSGIAEIVGAAAPIVSTGLGAYFGYKSQKAWAGAAEAGFEQCRLSQQDYMQYLQTNELPGLTPAQQAQMNCNGYNLNQYAGMGGGMSGWLGAGYTPGYIGGMLGPWGGNNPYGQGGYVGGAIGGAVGGMNGGMYGGYNGGYVQGGYNGGMAGGFVNGISIAGGYNAGGYNGGYVQGGYNGGYATGYVAGGYVQGGYAQGGYVAGGYNGGFQGGYNGGMAGGFVNGISIAGGFNGGFNGGMNGGYVQGGYVAGGYNGGYVAAGQVGGYVQGGYVAGGYVQGGYVAGGYVQGGYAAGGYAQGGYAAGGYAQGGYAAGGYAQGGYAAGGFNGGYQDLANSQNAANYDRMLQQQGTGFQMGALGGSAAYSPMNAGFGINATVNGSFGGF